jgi:hypothetical protein
MNGFGDLHRNQGIRVRPPQVAQGLMAPFNANQSTSVTLFGTDFLKFTKLL